MFLSLLTRYLLPSLISGFLLKSVTKIIVQILIYLAMMILFSGIAGAISSSIL